MSASEQFVRRKFQEFYMSTSARFVLPPNMQEREYGFLMFKEKFMVRHRAFKTPNALQDAIRDLVPAHIYFSTAYYRDPTAPMDEKGWQGADLVFDIDADHLETPCKPTHDSWKCKACSTTGLGSTPKLCPKCKNDRFEEQTWLCEKCLQHAKEETEKLLEIMLSDFGVDPGNLRIFFSGHRGYHVHTYSPELAKLGEGERKEIVDYVLGQGLEPELHDLQETSSGGVKIVEGPLMGQPGWRGRIVQGMYDLLSDEAGMPELGPGQVKAITSWNREDLFRKPFWSSLKGVGLNTWKVLVGKAVESRSARIDTVVTTDVHRLIRLPGTLNGHTGLLAVQVRSEQFDEFDPFSESVAFQGTVRVRVREAPEFRLGETHFGPFHEEVVELPGAAALLLLCKRRAEYVA